jgi:hypothetical protein
MLTYPCPTCGAAPGEKCRTHTGNRINSAVHADRVADMNHCPRCGARTPADDEPGQLCARCELVRSLEVERATRHERRNP